MSETNPKHAGIHAALAAISRDAGAIGKDSRNATQGFNFRGIDAVMNHLHPLFARHGVVILPEVLAERTEDRETAKGSHLIYRVLTIKERFAHESGSSAECTVIGEGMDSGDKASNKAMAVALKYALTQMLLLPYDEVDPDADTPPDSKPKGPPARAPVAMPVRTAAAPKPPQGAPEEDAPWTKDPGEASEGAPVDEKPPLNFKTEEEVAASHVKKPKAIPNTNMVAVVMESVKTKEGRSAKGPWKRTYAKGTDGEWYQTFDTKIGDTMENLQGTEVSVIYKIEKTDKGESRNVVSIGPVQG
jgi:hypothetical protein